MTVSTLSSNLGRHLFGVAAAAFGLITLVWLDYNGWHQPRYILYAVAVALIFGGAAIQFRPTAKTGAVFALCGLSCLRLAMRAGNRHRTADLQ